QTDQLISKAMHLLEDEKQLHTISKNARLLGKPNATRDIVKQIFNLNI